MWTIASCMLSTATPCFELHSSKCILKSHNLPHWMFKKIGAVQLDLLFRWPKGSNLTWNKNWLQQYYDIWHRALSLQPLNQQQNSQPSLVRLAIKVVSLTSLHYLSRTSRFEYLGFSRQLRFSTSFTNGAKAQSPQCIDWSHFTLVCQKSGDLDVNL